jgi:hypothetical protein
MRPLTAHQSQCDRRLSTTAISTDRDRDPMRVVHSSARQETTFSQPTRFVAKRFDRDRLDYLPSRRVRSLINATRNCSRTVTARPAGLHRYTAM